MRRRPRLIPRRRALTVAAAALVVGLLAAGGAAAASPSAPLDGRSSGSASGASSRTVDPSNVTVSVFAENAGLVGPGQDASVSVVVDNHGDLPLQPGQVDLGLTGQPFTADSALTAWVKAPTTSGGRALATAPSTAVPGGVSAIVATIDVPAAALGFSDSDSSVWGLTATLSTPDGGFPVAGSPLVYQGTDPSRVGVAVAMPLTVPGRTDGLISSSDLASYTGPDGLLARQLEIVQQDPTLTVGIDPMIIASIRVLGSSAPATAKTWLSELAALDNDTFPLQYADADVSAEVQSGLKTLLAPSSFDYAMKAGNFSTPLTVGEPTDDPQSDQNGQNSQGDQGDQTGQGSEQNGTKGTPSPSPTPTAPSSLPTVQQLLDWPYTLSGVAWPGAASVRSSDLTAFAQNKLTTTILSGDNTNAATLPGTPGAALRVPGGTVLVSDAGLSASLSDAAGSSSVLTAGQSSSALTAELALDAQNASPGTVLLATLDRGWPSSVEAAIDAVRALTNSPFSSAATLPDAAQSTATAGLEVKDAPEAAARLAAIGSLLDREGDPRSGGAPASLTISAFSTVLTQPELLTGPTRNQLLSLLAVDWPQSTTGNWSSAVADALNAGAGTLAAVQISSPGTITQLSNQALIPITVTNKLAYPVDVVLRATPSSARLEIDSDTEKQIPAGASAKVLIPVKAQLGNGRVSLSMRLFSKTGVPIGDPAQATVTVHADWEGIGAALFGIIVVGFLVFGIVRTVRRRRREKRAQAEPQPSKTEDSDG